MSYANALFRAPALLAIGFFTFGQTSQASEMGVSGDARANETADAADDDKKKNSRQRKDAAEMASAVTANGERLDAAKSWTLAQVSAETPQESPFPDDAEADRVIVTGTNINVGDSPPFVPETIFDREAVERAGSRSLGDFFQSLPQNSGPSFTENQNESLAPGGAAVALRGLPPDATLVLINGRRVAPYPFAQNGITAFVDLNSIPLAAIRQIDILRDGASAIYGTDAIAGVVNVRFLEKYDGALLSVGYGNTTDTDTSEYRASLITGYADERGGTELVVVADYFHREALFQVDRYFSRSIDQRRQGGSSFLSSVANPGTVFDPMTGDPLRVPANSDGTPEVSEFRPGRNRFDRAPFQPLVPEAERFGFTTRAKIRLAPAVDLFTEFGYRNTFTKQQLAPAPIEGDVESISVPAANPFNPFRADVIFRYRVTEAGPRVDEIDSDFYRAVAGIKLYLPGRWELESALLFSQTDTEVQGFNNLSRSAVIAALAETNPATSFNVFGAGDNVNNPATIQSFLVTTTREGKSSLYGADAKMNGPLFSLPAGELLTAFGMEFRREDLDDQFDPLSARGGVIDLNSTSASGNHEIIAGFAEFYAPVVSNQMAVPGIHKLEAQFAVRGEKYSDFGSTVNPKIGLAWQPIPDWLLVRASWSTGFRAPSLVQSSTGSLTFSQELRDTTRFAVTGAPEDESQSLQILSGGNPNLDSEDSENFSTGFVLTPPVVPGLTFSADYFHIEIENSIASLDPQFILDNEGDFPGLVVRAPASASDVALGIPGDVLLVNTSFQNLGFIRVQGIDATLEYITPKTPIGTFTVRMDAACMLGFEQQSGEGQPVRELVGTFARPQLRGRAQLGWRIGGFEAITTFNYIDSYEDLPADRTVDCSTTVDVLLEYRFAKAKRVTAESNADAGKKIVESLTQVQRDRWLEGLAVRVGVRNIFDDPPPFANNTAGYPVPLEDPRQRFVFVDIEKMF
jgi:outer membrane receptor protein involved in Fe transport